MPLTKTLAAISAGALMLIGHTAVAQDPYTDRTQDRQATTQQQHTQTQTERDRAGTTAHTQAQVRTQDDLDDDEDEFVAGTAWDDDEDDDEFTAGAQWETDADTTAQTWDDDRTATDTRADAEFRADVDTRDDRFAQDDQFAQDRDFDAQVGMTDDVDDQRLETLAQIHLEMQDETREIADEMAVAASAEEAQQFQARMVERQVDVIERHGWSREEYNQVVDLVNEDPELRSRFIDMVVQRDDQVGARFDDDAEFTAEADWDDDQDDEFQAGVQFEEDRDATVAGEFEDDRR